MREGEGMANIGKHIKKFRMQKNMTQDELAEKLFVSRQTISNYENNKSHPDIEVLVKIADIFETDVNTLVNGEETHNEQRKKAMKCIIKITILFIIAIILVWFRREVLYRYQGIGVFMSPFIIRVVVDEIISSSFCAVFGYHVMKGILLLLQTEGVKGKFVGSIHKAIQMLFCAYYVIMLPYWLHSIIEVIDFWKWKMTENTGGWSPSVFEFFPAWDWIVDKISWVHFLYPEVFMLIFFVIGALLGIIKKEKN